MTRTLVDRLVSQSASWLQPLGEWLHSGVERAVGSQGKQGQAAKDFLNGVWLGHPLHPAVTDVPIGAWSSAAILDLVDVGSGGGPGRAADLLIAAGCLGGLTAAASGLADWQDKYGHERDIGTAHALLNSSALVLYGLSLGSRLRGRRRLGVLLSFAGLGVASGGAYLGGDLVFRLGVQVNRNAFREGPQKWRSVTEDSEVKEGELLTCDVSGNKVILTRQGGRICAVGAICSHSGGPLDQEPLRDGQVSCPWHGSKFDVATGEVTQGPASVSLPLYETRIAEGKVELRRGKA